MTTIATLVLSVAEPTQRLERLVVLLNLHGDVRVAGITAREGSWPGAGGVNASLRPPCGTGTSGR